MSAHECPAAISTADPSSPKPPGGQRRQRVGVEANVRKPGVPGARAVFSSELRERARARVDVSEGREVQAHHLTDGDEELGARLVVEREEAARAKPRRLAAEKNDR